MRLNHFQKKLYVTPSHRTVLTGTVNVLLIDPEYVGIAYPIHTFV